MNFGLQTVFYPSFAPVCVVNQPYCVVNQPYLVYSMPQTYEPVCVDFKQPDAYSSNDDSKDVEPQLNLLSPKVQQTESDDLEKPAISLTESDLEKYICNVNRKLWTEEEDEKLKVLAVEHDLDWKIIATSFPERNPNQCYGRYRRIIRDSKRRGWSKREDEILKECVEKYGQCWKVFTKYLENRTSKQIRERYLNSLRPNIVNEDWKVDEDKKICELINTYGRKWKLFEEYLPGRTENRIKNRFYGHIKKIQVLKTKQTKYREMKRSKRVMQ